MEVGDLVRCMLTTQGSKFPCGIIVRSKPELTLDGWKFYDVMIEDGTIIIQPNSAMKKIEVVNENR
jgi:hypothetical protein